jgi:hypothetical protein
MAASIGEIALLSQLLQLSHVGIRSGCELSAEIGDQDRRYGLETPRQYHGRLSIALSPVEP